MIAILYGIFFCEVECARPSYVRIPFSLCEESLFIQIRGHENIKIIAIGNYELNISAYADDANL